MTTKLEKFQFNFEMKVAIVLLLIALVFVQDSESWRLWRKVKTAVKRIASNVKKVARGE